MRNCSGVQAVCVNRRVCGGEHCSEREEESGVQAAMKMQCKLHVCTTVQKERDQREKERYIERECRGENAEPKREATSACP